MVWNTGPMSRASPLNPIARAVSKRIRVSFGDRLISQKKNPGSSTIRGRVDIDRPPLHSLRPCNGVRFVSRPLVPQNLFYVAVSGTNHLPNHPLWSAPKLPSVKHGVIGGYHRAEPATRAHSASIFSEHTRCPYLYLPLAISAAVTRNCVFESLSQDVTKIPSADHYTGKE